MTLSSVPSGPSALTPHAEPPIDRDAVSSLATGLAAFLPTPSSHEVADVRTSTHVIGHADHTTTRTTVYDCGSRMRATGREETPWSPASSGHHIELLLIAIPACCHVNTSSCC